MLGAAWGDRAGGFLTTGGSHRRYEEDYWDTAGAKTAYERLTVQAATTGDPVLARKALLAHPLVGQTAKVADLLEDLLGVAAP